MRAYGVPREILTDNGKVFTGRFGPGTGEVLFDRICRENGIKHLLTAPRSPTTTGKVERWHKTLRREFLNGKVFESIADAQEQLDRWVHEYNHERRHQGIGDVVPWERFRLASAEPVEPVELVDEPTTTRRVGKTGKISFAAASYPVGVWLAGETVEVSVANGLVSDPPSRGARRHPRPTASSCERGSGADPEGQAASGHGHGRRPSARACLARSTHRATSASPAATIAWGVPTSAARCRSRSSVTASRSPPAVKSSRSIRYVTTAPARTGPSPTPAAGPRGSTPPKPPPRCNTGTGAKPEHGYRDLTVSNGPGLLVDIPGKSSGGRYMRSRRSARRRS